MWAAGARLQTARGAATGDRKQLHLLRVKQQRNRNRSRSRKLAGQNAQEVRKHRLNRKYGCSVLPQGPPPVTHFL